MARSDERRKSKAEREDGRGWRKVKKEIEREKTVESENTGSIEDVSRGGREREA